MTRTSTPRIVNVRPKMAAPPVRTGALAQLMGGYNRALPRRGTRDTLAAFRRSPILRSIGHKIAMAVASQPWWVEVETGEGPQRVDNHPLERFITSGTPMLNGMQTTVQEELSLLLVGESFSALEFNQLPEPYAFPIRRYAMASHWAHEVPQTVDGIFRFVPTGRQPFTLARSQVLWMKEVDPLEPYERGAGAGAALSDELETDERAAQHTASTLGNRALPEFIVSGESPRADEAFEPMDKETVTRLQETLDSRYGGPRNRGKTFVSRAPLRVQTLTPSFAELELTRLREFEIDMLLHGYGMPPELIGRLNSSNRATIEAAEYLFSKHVVLPRLVMRKSSLNDQIVPMFGDNVRLCFESPVEEDREHKAKVVSENADAFTTDERRALVGADPLPDGAGKRFAMDMRRDYREHVPVQVETRSAHATRLKMVRKADEDDVDAVVSGLPDDAFVPALVPEMEGAGAQFGEDALGEVGSEITFDLIDARVTDLIEARAAESSRLIVGTTRDTLRRTLMEGVAQGESTQALVGRIRETLGPGTTASRARMISRTEIVWTSNTARDEAFVEAGVTEREWLATADGNVREGHEELDGTVIAIDEEFDIDGDRSRVPGGFSLPENSINCRCTVIPRVPEDQSRDWRVATWKTLDSQRAPFERRLEAAVQDVFASLARDAAAIMESRS
ncbi:MAG: phage portal protein [Pseudomonadota bacterium]